MRLRNRIFFPTTVFVKRLQKYIFRKIVLLYVSKKSLIYFFSFNYYLLAVNFRQHLH